MKPGERPDFPTEHLDMARGLAALAVAAWHTRSLFFQDYDRLVDPGLPTRALYFLTGFGHEAVMVFFVLSGYFIASSVVRDWAADRFSWHRYLINRATRLWIVLVPALLIGVCWDVAGQAAFGREDLPYGRAAPGEGTTVVDFTVWIRLSWFYFLGNVLFLQTIMVPELGSNTPLWSLAYEFWYYVMFPLGLVALGGRAGWRSRALHGLALLVVALTVGPKIVGYFAIWLLGAAVSVARPPAFADRPWYPLLAFGLAGLVFGGALTAARLHLVKAIAALDFAVGLGCAAFLYALLTVRLGRPGPRYAAIARTLAGCSYTLYLVHLPVLLFFSVAVGRASWPPDAPHVLAGAFVLAAVVLYAWLIAQFTEAHTTRLRDFLLARTTAG